MKKDSAFKLKSGNQPSIAKMFGMMKTMKKNMQTAKDNRSKRDMSKAPKAMQNLNKAIGDALGSTGNLRKKISDKITSKKSKNYTIKKGDTLTKIAKANNTTVDAIMKKNTQIKDKNLIYSGKTLKLQGNTLYQ